MKKLKFGHKFTFLSAISSLSMSAALAATAHEPAEVVLMIVCLLIVNGFMPWLFWRILFRDEILSQASRNWMWLVYANSTWVSALVVVFVAYYTNNFMITFEATGEVLSLITFLTLVAFIWNCLSCPDSNQNKKKETQSNKIVKNMGPRPSLKFDKDTFLETLAFFDRKFLEEKICRASGKFCAIVRTNFSAQPHRVISVNAQMGPDSYYFRFIGYDKSEIDVDFTYAPEKQPWINPSGNAEHMLFNKDVDKIQLPPYLRAIKVVLHCGTDLHQGRCPARTKFCKFIDRLRMLWRDYPSANIVFVFQYCIYEPESIRKFNTLQKYISQASAPRVTLWRWPYEEGFCILRDDALRNCRHIFLHHFDTDLFDPSSKFYFGACRDAERAKFLTNSVEKAQKFENEDAKDIIDWLFLDKFGGHRRILHVCYPYYKMCRPHFDAFIQKIVQAFMTDIRQREFEFTLEEPTA